MPVSSPKPDVLRATGRLRLACEMMACETAYSAMRETHKTGKASLWLKRLTDVDFGVLYEIVGRAVRSLPASAAAAPRP